MKPLSAQVRPVRLTRLTRFTRFTRFTRIAPVLAPLMLLASCSSPPKPPTVDESRRRPANSALAVELQACKGDLQNTQQLAVESERIAQSATETLTHLAARQRLLSELQQPAGPPAAGNIVLHVRFEFGSTRVDIEPQTAKALIAEAMGSPLVWLRGRTDGSSDAPAESRIARERAAAVRDYLVGAGIDAGRIRTTYQPVGDHVANNWDAGGRALNRRVEVEIYRALPVVLPVARPVALGTAAASR
ncbi:OmpA family protein [Roseateles sp.]|uniref:OmpA family protein n=1 Tax=Roseateles sp. TaxID=1971397 RepID=UPI0039EAA631